MSEFTVSFETSAHPIPARRPRQVRHALALLYVLAGLAVTAAIADVVANYVLMNAIRAGSVEWLLDYAPEIGFSVVKAIGLVVVAHFIRRERPIARYLGFGVSGVCFWPGLSTSIWLVFWIVKMFVVDYGRFETLFRFYTLQSVAFSVLMAVLSVFLFRKLAAADTRIWFDRHRPAVPATVGTTFEPVSATEAVYPQPPVNPLG